MKSRKILITLIIMIFIVNVVSACGETNESVTSQETDLVNASESGDSTLSEASSDVSGDIEDLIQTVENDPIGEYDFTIAYTGDVNLNTGWPVYMNLDTNEFDADKCISEEIISELRNADILVINNEFTFSDSMTPTPGKYYTFKTDSSLVSVLNDIGVDAANLANNHAYDYGEESMLDTMEALKGADIPYFGAGANLEEAMRPLFFEIDGKRIALVSASRAEKNLMTPQATENSAGILRCYDTTLFEETIRQAKENADIVLAYVHWGTENTTVLEAVQLDTAKIYLDAGADAIIGAHPHTLQGFDWYEGKSIAYSLGNFWFNEVSQWTVVYKLHFYGNDQESHVETSIVPCLQVNGGIVSIDDEEKQEVYRYLENLSYDTKISENGMITYQEDER